MQCDTNEGEVNPGHSIPRHAPARGLRDRANLLPGPQVAEAFLRHLPLPIDIGEGVDANQYQSVGGLDEGRTAGVDWTDEGFEIVAEAGRVIGGVKGGAEELAAVAGFCLDRFERVETDACNDRA